MSEADKLFKELGLFEIETDIQKFTINGQNPFIVDYHIK